MPEVASRHSPSFLFDRAWVWIGCCVVFPALTVWARTFIPWQVMASAFGFLFVGALLLDLVKPSKQRSAIRKFIIPTGLLLLAVLPMLSILFEAWAEYYVSWWSTGPLVPYSDAAGYVNGARSLLTFGQLTEWAARRPLAICLMAAVLGATNDNLQNALIVFALLTGIATFFAAQETWRAGGLAAAILHIALSYFAMRQWLPLFMTETTGYIFGSLAYGFLLGGFRLRSWPRTLLGLGFLIVALTARPGAMFAIPLLALYAIFFFSRNVRQAFRNAFAASLIAVVGFGFGPLLLKQIAPPETEFQGSLAYTLYGLASGGKRWTHVVEEHPEIAAINSDGEKARYIYALFRKKVAADPWLFVSTFFRMLQGAAGRFHLHLYGLMRPIPLVIPGVLAAVAFCLLILPAWRREGTWTFLVSVTLGILLSAPFLADGGLRVLVATLPFHAGLAVSAVGLAVVRTAAFLERRKTLGRSAVPGAEEPAVESAPVFAWNEAAFALLILGAVTVFPLIASVWPVRDSVLSWSRLKNEGSPKEVVFYHNPSSGILLEAESSVPGVMEVPVRSVTSTQAFAQELRVANHLQAGHYLYHAFVLQEPDQPNLIFRFDEVPQGSPAYLRAVLRLLEERDGCFLYAVDSFSRLEP